MEKSMADFCEGVVNESFTKPGADGELRPRVYVLTKDGTFWHFDYVGDNEEQMESMRRSICLIIVASRMAGTFGGVGFVAEAWTSRLGVGEQRKYARCEDDPNRGEVVFYVSYEEGTEKKSFKSWDIQRDGKKFSIKEKEGIDPKGWHTWLDKPFAPLGNVPPVVVEQAKAMLAGIKGGRKPVSSN